MTGAKKAPAVATALTQRVLPGQMPAQMVRPEGEGARLVWMMDAGAASELQALGGIRAMI